MEPCERAKSSILPALRAELGAEEARALARHLASCPQCAEEYRGIEQAWALLDRVAVAAPPPQLRDAVLSVVAATREREARTHPPWRAALLALVPGVLAALASLVLIVLPDPDCNTPLAVACCGALWAGLYALAFTVLAGSQRKSFSRALAGRALIAAAGGLLLVRLCPAESSAGFTVPLLDGLAAAASTSAPSAFGLGLLVAAVPLSLALLFVRPGGVPQAKGGLAMSGIYFALLAPALYLASGPLAFTGLLTLLAGAAAGSLVPTSLELLLRKRTLGGA
jgi:hypothetical protein